MKESACSEQSQRMTAMDGATKNAGLFNVLLTLLPFMMLRLGGVETRGAPIIS